MSRHAQYRMVYSASIPFCFPPLLSLSRVRNRGAFSAIAQYVRGWTRDHLTPSLSLLPSPSPLLSEPIEGPLQKWTNMMRGWQLRYFQLDPKQSTLHYHMVCTTMWWSHDAVCRAHDGHVIQLGDHLMQSGDHVMHYGGHLMQSGDHMMQYGGHMMLMCCCLCSLRTAASTLHVAPSTSGERRWPRVTRTHWPSR